MYHRSIARNLPPINSFILVYFMIFSFQEKETTDCWVLVRGVVSKVSKH